MLVSAWTKLRDHLDQMGANTDGLDPSQRQIFDIRPNEQDYAKLSDKEVKSENRYGQKIDLLELTANALPAERPMFINDNPEVGCNPNRNKQHGFHFTADNCIGCHACEAACSEKNDLPPHIAFRSVGYVEGGSYPDYKRLNISMACNHCDDPVCLKGCPTRAYSKHVEYGAVLQDPETCFGCGYCTWVCPYNAPQLDPIKGQVSKCNMCVDRLEVGLKPACVAACLGNALNFGVIENTPENREQVETAIPGFPTTDITHPNIRFQQTRSMPNEMSRTDSMPIKYHKDEDGKFRSVVDEKLGKEQFWNVGRLSSRENPLVIFTLATQAVIGAFMMVFLGPLLGFDALVQVQQSGVFFPMLIAMAALQAGVLVLSTLHLGKPLRFYRGFNNLKHSPLSREALGVAMFLAGMCGYLALELINLWLEWSLVSFLSGLLGMFAVVAGIVGVYFMHCIYRIKARPFWNHWQVLTSFFGTMFSLGAVIVGIFAVPAALVADQSAAELLPLLAGLSLVGIVAEVVGLWSHAKDMDTEAGEGAASHYIQCTTFGKTYQARNLVLAIAMLATAGLALLGGDGVLSLTLALLLVPILTVALLAGRALFYVLVIPTTMPGAFFWRNKGFEQHARDIGLAEMPQVGVVPDLH